MYFIKQLKCATQAVSTLKYHITLAVWVYQRVKDIWKCWIVHKTSFCLHTLLCPQYWRPVEVTKTGTRADDVKQKAGADEFIQAGEEKASGWSSQAWAGEETENTEPNS